ncbi:adenylyl-sulfate reductase [Thiobacillus sp. 65-1402]|mgnify:FL=1|uniref:adenylyl-sulfate reductase n=1 Tax=Thiobacillus sp. 65-1402 TaxID=1895861 RepID=UPI0025D2275B|nr:adenylyl-sulfate reductase [Thiobacillus sp. 65-1402]
MVFTDNPFIPATDFLPPSYLQAYIVLMVLAVVAGTVFDLHRKRSAEFFARQQQRSRVAAVRQLSGAEMAAIAARTLANEVATSGEFCNRSRRVSHLLMSYGFVLYLVTTLVLVFGYPADPHTPAVLPVLWNVGILMVLVGGYWFFFFLRVNVAHDGHSPWRLVRADLFIVALLASVTFALIFEVVTVAQNTLANRVFFGLYILFSTLLFGSVAWSKFAHMFYKPAVALQRRLEEANGSSDLPASATAGEGRCPPSPT